MCVQVVSYPLALIRTRLQAQGLPGRPLKYRNMADVLQKTIEREGLRGKGPTHIHTHTHTHTPVYVWYAHTRRIYALASATGLDDRRCKVS